MQDFFKLSNSVVDSESLSIYEKMCCVVLARLYNDDLSDISIELLAKKMNVEEIVAKGAFYSLMSKGILELADKSQLVQAGTIIKAHTEVFVEKEPLPEISESDDVVFKDSDLTLSHDEKIHRICELLDEKISVREAQIILSFANGEIQKVVEKYKIAKASQYKDKVEVLLHELQKKEERKSNVIKSSESSLEVKPFTGDVLEDDEVLRKTQLNTYKISQMKKYKQK